MKFRGTMTAIVTPMQAGEIDEFGLRGLVDHQIEAGIAGLIACGSTGEGATLTNAEQAHVVDITVQQASGRVPVIAGIGARSTHGAFRRPQR